MGESVHSIAVETYLEELIRETERSIAKAYFDRLRKHGQEHADTFLSALLLKEKPPYIIYSTPRGIIPKKLKRFDNH